MNKLSIAVCIVAQLGLAGLARLAFAANPEDPGGLKVTTSGRTEQIAGKDVTFDLYVPQGLSSPAPVVAIGHGFQRNKDKMAGWGEALAARGYVAAALDFPGMLPDHPLNGELIAGLLDWLVAQGGVAGSPLAGLVDGARKGVVGHSAGGLAAYLAAAKDPTIRVVVGLDPVDTDLGQKAAPGIKAATIVVRAAPGTCNSQGNAEQIYQAFGGPKVTLRVKGANHCDAESPSDSFCGIFCGGDHDAARHAIFRRYAFAMLDYVLRCDDAMAPWLAGPSAQADPAIEDLRSAGLPPTQASCGGAPPVDAGQSPADAGPSPDGAQPGADAGAPIDGRPVATDAASPDSGSGGGGDDGGCGVAPRGAPGGPLGVLLLGLLLMVRLGRRP